MCAIPNLFISSTPDMTSKKKTNQDSNNNKSLSKPRKVQGKASTFGRNKESILPRLFAVPIMRFAKPLHS
jgi:hypothetical protein